MNVKFVKGWRRGKGGMASSCVNRHGIIDVLRLFV